MFRISLLSAALLAMGCASQKSGAELTAAPKVAAEQGAKVTAAPKAAAEQGAKVTAAPKVAAEQGAKVTAAPKVAAEGGAELTAAPKVAAEGRCPRDAVWEKGRCLCVASNVRDDEDESYAGFMALRAERRWLGEDFRCGIGPDADPQHGGVLNTAYCDRLEGCISVDGRHYAPWHPADDQMYYVLGSPNQVYATQSPAGDCVLPGGVLPSLTLENSVAIKDQDRLYWDKTLRVKTPWGGDDEGAELYDSEKVEASREIARVYDGRKCVGGERYCRGYDNDPIPAPQKGGYICKRVDSYRGATGGDYKAWVCADASGCACGGGLCPESYACIDDHCVCGAEPWNQDAAYACVKGREVCRGGECVCGEHFIPGGYSCKGGNAFCGDEPIRKERGYQCDSEEWLSGFEQACSLKEGCRCGDGLVGINMQCLNDLPYCGDVAVTDAFGAFSCVNRGTSFLDSTERSLICEREAGCPFGGDVCPLDAKLDQNRCSCEDVAWHGDGSAYRCEGRFAVCQQENCSCGLMRCAEGAACVDGACFCGADRLSLGYACQNDNVGNGFLHSVPVCIQAQGCACGGSVCARGQACKNDRCLDLSHD